MTEPIWRLNILICYWNYLDHKHSVSLCCQMFCIIFNWFFILFLWLNHGKHHESCTLLLQGRSLKRNTVVSTNLSLPFDRYLFLFLKFIASVIPTIEYDYTMDFDLGSSSHWSEVFFWLADAIRCDITDAFSIGCFETSRFSSGCISLFLNAVVWLMTMYEGRQAEISTSGQDFLYRRRVYLCGAIWYSCSLFYLLSLLPSTSLHQE